MKYCPQCYQKYVNEQRFCLDDGVEIVPDPFFLSGQTLGDKYQIESLIEMGGMGAVYRARHLYLNLPVAFKIVRPDQANRTLLRLFEKEAQIAAPLRHPNIVEVYDAGRVKARNQEGQEIEISYLAMEWLDGHTLSRKLHEQGRLSFEYTQEILQQVCDALDTAHNKLTIHRDLKPSNIMLVRQSDGRERVKVLDFGVGKVMSSADGTNVTLVAGTEQYASPEQKIKGARIGPRSDIYSLGVLLFEMLTDSLPETSPPQALRSLRTDAPAALEKLLMEMLAKEPDGRPSKVSEISRRFSAALTAGKQPSPPIVVEPKPQPGRPPDQTPETRPQPPKQPMFEFITVTLNNRGEEIERRKGQASGFIEDLGDGITLEMVRVPGATFLRGSPEEEDQRSSNEGPQREVTVPTFFMGRYQITQEQWRLVAKLPKVGIELKPDPSYFKGSNLPVEQVNWHEAVEFCQRLTKKTGHAYRLPSEAEWEYACRAGTTTPFAFGETITPEIVNYDGNFPYASAPKGEYRQKTVPVGSLGVANAFGLYDLHGNVWEWCEDVWHDNYNGAPTDGRAWTSGGDQNRRVLRGGSWFLIGRYCRAAVRYYLAPGVRDNYIGFRVVVSARTP